jgi:hypothetical protein
MLRGITDGNWTKATPERDEAIWLAVLAGRTLQSVGDEFGMTRERIRQIYARHQRHRGESQHVPYKTEPRQNTWRQRIRDWQRCERERRKWAMARVVCEVEETELEGDHGLVPSVILACSRCGATTESFGTGEASIRRCLALMREECPEGEKNWYVVEGDEWSQSDHFVAAAVARGSSSMATATTLSASSVERCSTSIRCRQKWRAWEINHLAG